MAGSPSDQKAITVAIAGRRLTLHVKVKEESAVRAMVTEINDRYGDYQVRFSDRDELDCMMMTLLTYADELRTLRPAVHPEKDSELTGRLEALTGLVDGML